MGALRLSVIIPTHGRPALLERGLEGLVRQTLARDRFEVLVVDDGSPSPPEELVARFAGRLPIRLVRKPHGGLAHTRNRGAAEASGDVLLFMDDDILPCPGFLEAHLRVHESRDRVVVLGALPHPEDVPFTPFLYYLERILHYDLFRRFGSAENIPLPPLNGNSSVRRRWFEAAGGYDLTFASYGGEDTELGYRLLRSGLEFAYAPDARGFHYHAKGYDAYRKDMASSGAAIVAIVRKHPEVAARVNLDLVTGRLSDLPWGKRVRRLVLIALERMPFVVSVLEGIIARTERFGWNRALYPLYVLAAHYHYARGMRAALARPVAAGLEPAPAAR